MGVEQIETFWLEVGQAYQKVAANHELSAIVERADKRAIVRYDILDGYVEILVEEADTHEVETLVAP